MAVTAAPIGVPQVIWLQFALRTAVILNSGTFSFPQEDKDGSVTRDCSWLDSSLHGQYQTRSRKGGEPKS